MRTPPNSGSDESRNSDASWAIDAAEFAGGDGYGLMARATASGFEFLFGGGEWHYGVHYGAAYLEGEPIIEEPPKAAKPVIGIDGYGDPSRDMVTYGEISTGGKVRQDGSRRYSEGTGNIFELDGEASGPVIGI